MSSSVADTLHLLLPDDLGTLDTTGAADRLSLVKACRGFLDAYEARLTRHINLLHAAGESAPAADLHTRNGGVSSREARQKERRAKTLESAPSLAERLEAGDVTAAHADALADVTSRLDDDTKAAFFDHEELLAHDATRRTPGGVREELPRPDPLHRTRPRPRTRPPPTPRHPTHQDHRPRRHVRPQRPPPPRARHRHLQRPRRRNLTERSEPPRCLRVRRRHPRPAPVRATDAVQRAHRAHRHRHQRQRPRHRPHPTPRQPGPTPSPARHVPHLRLPRLQHPLPPLRDPPPPLLRARRLDRPAEPPPALCPRHHHLVHDQHWTLQLDHQRTLTIRDQRGDIHAVVPLPSSNPPLAATTNRTDDPPAQPPTWPSPVDRPPGRPPDPPGDQLSLFA